MSRLYYHISDIMVVTSIFTILYLLNKYNIYKVYGFKPLNKLILENNISGRKKENVKKYFLIFWILLVFLFLYVLSLFFIYAGVFYF